MIFSDWTPIHTAFTIVFISGCVMAYIHRKLTADERDARRAKKLKNKSNKQA